MSELARAAFGRYAPVLDPALRAAAPAGHPLYELVTYHLGWADERGAPVMADPGKRLRPTLCLLIGEALGGSISHLLPAAAAIELLHNFSLVHDDIEDGSLERRHRRTVWSLWGAAHGINAGDAWGKAATSRQKQASPAPSGSPGGTHKGDRTRLEPRPGE